MKIPLKYIIRNLLTRRTTSLLTVTGVTLVVFVFTAVLMLAHGLQKTLIATGSDDNVIVLRKSADAEITSIIAREQADIISSMAEVARAPDGRAFASKEIVVVINQEYADRSGLSNLTVRGVSPEAFAIRPQVKLDRGRLFNWGSREVIVGAAAARKFRGMAPGDQIKFGGDDWTIVGTFDAGGTGFDSEVWGDVEQLGQAFQRPVFSTVSFRLTQTDAFKDFVSAMEKDNRLQSLEAKREKQFYADQSEALATFIRVMGIAVTVIFSLGAMIGAMITMYGAVANRTVEIGTLRSLGFRRRSVLAAFVVESISISFAGWVLGVALASFLQFFSISMLNFQSFSELAFGFSLSIPIILISLTFALLMGVCGGFLPAVRAARLNILEALRAS